MAIKKKRFWYHYNKPASKNAGRNVITVHWEGRCYPVNKVICNVPTESHDQKRQPYCIIRGWCMDVNFIPIENGALAEII